MMNLLDTGFAYENHKEKHNEPDMVQMQTSLFVKELETFFLFQTLSLSIW